MNTELMEQIDVTSAESAATAEEMHAKTVADAIVKLQASDAEVGCIVVSGGEERTIQISGSFPHVMTNVHLVLTAFGQFALDAGIVTPPEGVVPDPTIIALSMLAQQHRAMTDVSHMGEPN